MTSLLDGLDFKKLEVEQPEGGDVIRIVQALAEHDLLLRRALEAALAVIEASMILENAETVTEIQVADVRCRSAEKALNIALAPFRKNQNA